MLLEYKGTVNSRSGSYQAHVYSLQQSNYKSCYATDLTTMNTQRILLNAWPVWQFY